MSWADTLNGSGVNLTNLAAFATQHGKLIAWSESAAHGCDGSYLTSVANWFDSLGTDGIAVNRPKEPAIQRPEPAWVAEMRDFFIIKKAQEFICSAVLCAHKEVGDELPVQGT